MWVVFGLEVLREGLLFAFYFVSSVYRFVFSLDKRIVETRILKAYKLVGES